MSEEQLHSSLRSAILERAEQIPIFATLGFRDIHLGPGTCRATVPRDSRYDGIFESFHGGLLITVADSAAALAVLTVCGADARVTTTEMSIRFLSPARSDVAVSARVIKTGGTLVPVAAEINDDQGALVALVHVTYFRIRPRT